MEYLQTKKSSFVKALTVNPDTKTVGILLSKLFNPEHDHLDCRFYIVDKNNKYQELGNTIKQGGGKYFSFSADPALPAGTFVFFSVHGSFFTGENTQPSAYSAHGNFLVPGFKLNTGRNFIKPHATPHPPALPLVYPTGDMEHTPEFRAIEKQVQAAYQKKYPDLNPLQIIKKYHDEILRQTTVLYRRQHPEEAAKHDKIERGRKHDNPNADDPVMKAYKAELNRRIKLAEENLSKIKDPQEKARRLEEAKQNITNELAHHFVANWREKAEAYEGKDHALNAIVGTGRGLDLALDNVRKFEAEQALKTTRKRNFFGRSRDTTSTTTPEEKKSVAESIIAEKEHAVELRGKYETPASPAAPVHGESPVYGPVDPGQVSETLQPPFNDDFDDLTDDERDQLGGPPNAARPPSSKGILNRMRAKNAAKTAAKTGQAAAKEAEKTEKEARRMFGMFKNFKFFGTTGAAFWIIIFGIVLFTFIQDLTGTESTGSANGGENTDNLTITKTGPDSVPNPKGDKTDKPIVYTITANNDSGTDVTITDPLPANTTFEDASGNPTYQDASGNEIKDVTNNKDKVKTVVWNLSASDASNGVTLSLLPTDKDSWVLNKASVVENTDNSPTGTPVDNGDPNAKPTTDDCGGLYGPNSKVYSADYAIQNNDLHANFGDPECTFTRHKFRQLLLQKDAGYAAKWYYMASCESHFDPNAMSPQWKVHNPDPAGVWGLLSMGRGLNGELDHGDVAWPKQTTNALNYNKNHDRWAYWSTAAGYYDKVPLFTNCH